MENRLPPEPEEPHEHDIESRIILKSISHHMGCKAVYADISPDTGQAFLFTADLAFLGVATVIVSEYCGGELVDRMKSNMIVGVELIDGLQVISNDKENFAGLMPLGKDMEDCLGALSPKYFDRLPDHVKRRNAAQW